MSENKKLPDLKRVIKAKGAILIAFSGGVDSSLIAKIAADQLGDNAVAVTIDSDVFSQRELQLAKEIAKEIGIKHRIVTTSELDNEEFTKNPINRCYHCKHEEMAELKTVAAEMDIKTIAFGVNMSDFGEHRPGIKALQEGGFFMPLVEANIEKPEISNLAKIMGLSNYNLPSTTCLASRIPYGKSITRQNLTQVEQAESFLYSLGVKQSRVRHYGETARIEVFERDINKLIFDRKQVVDNLKKIGFKYVTLDLQGYRSGSMNEVLNL